jgi:uncharacterized membrane protein YhaH (DUF805 family)
VTFLKGRINRATYSTMLGLVIFLYAAFTLMGAKTPGVSEVVLVFLCVPRLHDIGRSGWWVLVLFAIEIISVIAGIALLPADDLMAALGVATMIIVALLIVLGILPGQPRANRWGEPPEPGVQWKFKKRDNVAKVFD